MGRTIFSDTTPTDAQQGDLWAKWSAPAQLWQCTTPAGTFTQIASAASPTFTGVTTFDVTQTKASAASATLNAITSIPATVTITGSTNITTATGFNVWNMGIITYSAASALTISDAATLYIAGVPVGAGAGPATITRPYALWVGAGQTRFGGSVTINQAVNTTQEMLSITANASPSTGATAIALALYTTGGTVTVTGQSSDVYMHRLGVSVLTSGSVTTIPFAATLHIAGMPTASGSVTITQRYGIMYAAATNTGIVANAALSHTFHDGTTVLYGIDTRTTATGVNAHIFRSAAPTIASASGATYSTVSITAGTLIFSGTTTMTAVNGAGLNVAQPTLDNTSAGLTITTASTVYIAGAPTATGNATITNAYSLHVAAGIVFVATATASTSTTTGAVVITGGMGVTGTISSGNINAYGVNPAIVANSSSSTSYATFRLLNDQASTVRSLELDYSGSAFASAIITGAPTGEAGAVYTSGAYPLVLGTNNTANITIASGGIVTFANTTASTSTTTGSVLLAGGLGVVGAISSASVNAYGVNPLITTNSSSSTNYASVRLINNASRTLELDYSGSAYSGSIVSGSPTGECAAIYTTGAFPLVLGTNTTTNITIASGGAVTLTSVLNVNGATITIAANGKFQCASGVCGFAVVTTGYTLGSAGTMIVPNANMSGAANDAARDTLAGNLDGAIAVDTGIQGRVYIRDGGAWKYMLFI